jgi:hypothetical protein
VTRSTPAPVRRWAPVRSAALAALAVAGSACGGDEAPSVALNHRLFTVPAMERVSEGCGYFQLGAHLGQGGTAQMTYRCEDCLRVSMRGGGGYVTVEVDDSNGDRKFFLDKAFFTSGESSEYTVAVGADGLHLLRFWGAPESSSPRCADPSDNGVPAGSSQRGEPPR